MTSRETSYCCCVIIKNDTKTNMPKQTLNYSICYNCSILRIFYVDSPSLTLVCYTMQQSDSQNSNHTAKIKLLK